MISRTSRAGSGESIYASSTDGAVCTEPAFTEGTSPEAPVLTSTPNAARERNSRRLLEQELTSSSRSRSIYSLTHSSIALNNNHQERKEEKATANATAAWLVEDAWVLSSIDDCCNSLFLAASCNSVATTEVVR